VAQMHSDKTQAPKVGYRFMLKTHTKQKKNKPVWKKVNACKPTY